MALGAHSGVFFSKFMPSMRVAMSFFRNVPTVNAAGEEVYTPAATITVPASKVMLWRTGSRAVTNKAAHTYAYAYQAVLAGIHDIKHNDRCRIEGAECVVEAVEPLGAHMELTLGAIQPGNQ